MSQNDDCFGMETDTDLVSCLGHCQNGERQCNRNDNNALDDLLENIDAFLSDNTDEWYKHISCDTSSIRSDDHMSTTSSHFDNLRVSRKRKMSDSYDIDDINQKSTISLPPTLSDSKEYLMRIPWELYGAVNTAVNCGNTLKLKSLTDELFHEKCVLRWERSIFSMEKVGAKTMKAFFDALLRTVGPDGVIMIRDIKHHSIKNGLEFLKCKLSYSGTILYQHCMEEFQGFKSPHKSSVEYMDASKLSPEEIEKLRQSELAMRKQGLKIQIFGKMKVKFFIDSVTKKIVGYEEIFRLLSFNYVDAAMHQMQ